MTFRTILGALTALALPALGAPLAAHDFTVGDLRVDHPFAIATPPAARSGAGYLSIENTGATADRLIAVEADFEGVMIHATEIDAEGVARMRHVEAVEIAPGETVTLEPGGLHVMFTGLTEPFVEGDVIPAVLVFETAGPVEVEFNVETRAGAADHSDH